MPIPKKNAGGKDRTCTRTSWEVSCPSWHKHNDAIALGLPPKKIEPTMQEISVNSVLPHLARVQGEAWWRLHFKIYFTTLKLT